MPIIDVKYSQSSMLVFWRIELDSDDLKLINRLPSSDRVIVLKATTKKQRRERLSSRLCAKEILKEDYQGIDYLESGKPFLVNNLRNLSISHSKDVVCLALSDIDEVGIDIQLVSEKIKRVAKRVFNEDELTWANDDIGQLTELWCIKEAVYKAAQLKGLDFRSGILIQPNLGFFDVTVNNLLVKKKYKVKTMRFEAYYVSYVL